MEKFVRTYLLPINIIIFVTAFIILNFLAQTGLKMAEIAKEDNDEKSTIQQVAIDKTEYNDTIVINGSDVITDILSVDKSIDIQVDSNKLSTMPPIYGIDYRTYVMEQNPSLLMNIVTTARTYKKTVELDNTGNIKMIHYILQ